MTNLPPPPKRRRRLSNARGAPVKSFADCAHRAQNYKLKALSDEIAELIDKKLAEQEPSLAAAWKEAHPELGGGEDSAAETTHLRLVANFKQFFASLPSRSPIRSSAIKTFCTGIPSAEIPSLLPVKMRQVQYGLASPVPDLTYYLRELGFPRDKLGEKQVWALHWMELFCPFPSGRSKRYFTGTPESMYAAYLNWALSNSHPTLSPSTFASMRHLERIGIRTGDKFMNTDRILLSCLMNKLQALEATAENTAEISSLQQQISPLQKSITWVNQRKRAYHQAHQDLEHQPSTMILTCDFTSSDTSPEDLFINFVVVCATQAELPMPHQLLCDLAPPEEPLSLYCPAPETTKKIRRTKAEVIAAGTTTPKSTFSLNPLPPKYTARGGLF